MKLRELKAALNELVDSQLEQEAVVQMDRTGTIYKVNQTILSCELSNDNKPDLEEKAIEALGENYPIILVTQFPIKHIEPI